MADVPLGYGALNSAQTPAHLAAAGKADYRELVNELREQNFDTVRFATYRTACKLRFVQKKFNLHLVDIWNVIESFRENGLNAVEYVSEVKISRMELLLSTIYHNLNKRLPANQQIDTDRAISLLLSFLLAAYDRDNVGKLRVFSIKIALASLCAGKLLDKLRYVFSQISDSSGLMDHHKFADYLREVLALPTAVFEGPTFGFSDSCVRQCFDSNAKISINNFLDALMADPCAPCLMWLPLLHRMASVEHVFHPVTCDGCQRDSFTGFRYKCQRCHNYQLCQECFWRGRVSGSHTNQHEMKEYSSYKSPTKQLGHSISKSLQCMPHHTKQAKHALLMPDMPERVLDLSNAVPASPSLARHQAFQQQQTPSFSNRHSPFYSDGAGDTLSRMKTSTLSSPGGRGAPFFLEGSTDDEHKLIARYSAKLAGRATIPGTRGDMINEAENQTLLIARLEQKNKEVSREIQRLQAIQVAGGSAGQGSMHMMDGVGGGMAPMMNAELDTLRHRKFELECRMQQLQDTRRELLNQLESVMGVLRNQTPREGSPRSPSNLSAVGSDVRAAFQHRDIALSPPYDGGPAGSLAGTLSSQRRVPARQTDLLSAADSITNTVSTLVKELDSDEEDRDLQRESNVPSTSRKLTRNGNHETMNIESATMS